MERVDSKETVIVEEEEAKTDTGDTDEPEDVDILLHHGLSLDDITALKQLGLNTLKGLDMICTKELMNITRFDNEKISKIQSICAQYNNMQDPFMTASTFYEQRKQLFRIGTGSSNLNMLLGGGIEAKSITEVFGENGTGKTQLAHTLCVTAQMPGPNDYMGGNVIYIDTENSFRPERLRDIAERFNLDVDTVLANVLYTKAYNSEHQYMLLNKVAQKLHESPGLFKLLIVDSIISLFRVDFIGQKDIMYRQQNLSRMLSRLIKLSHEYNVAIFITNQIMSDMGSNLLTAKPTKAAGGYVLAHTSTTRVSLNNTTENNKKLAKLWDSPHLESGEILYAITSGGIDDPID